MPAGERRLAAIMFADLAGFTARSQQDEAGALAALRDFRGAVTPLFPEFGGRAVKTLGDGLLVEFGSALRATECAIRMQEEVSRLNAPGGREPIALRIGLHVGDVVPEGDDILGDAVNVASRIEPIAEPGGICVSAPVFEDVRYKLPHTFVQVGELELKGLRAPLGVYRLTRADPVPAPTPPPSAGPGARPRLAVLPFESIGTEPSDTALADGLAEELTSVLAKEPALTVIARTSTHRYRRTDKPVRQIGAELQAQFLLEGSVRHAAGKLRITVQLIEVATELHRWSESFDRSAADPFAVQTEVARATSTQVAQALAATGSPAGHASGETEAGRLCAEGASLLRHAEEERWALERDSRPVLGAARTVMDEPSHSRENRLEAVERETRAAEAIFRRASEREPGRAEAHAGVARAIIARLALPRHGVSEPSWKATLMEALRWAEHARELDPDRAETHALLGFLFTNDYRRPDAEQEFRRAIALDPRSVRARTWYAGALFEEHRDDDALEQLVLAEETDPSLPDERIQLMMNLVSLIPVPPVPDAPRAIYYAAVRKPEVARPLAETIATLPESTRGKAQVLALVYAYLGEAGRCLEWLQRSAQRHESTAAWWAELPRLGGIRADHRFREIFPPD